MAKKKHSLSQTEIPFEDGIPAEYQSRWHEIVSLTDDFCDRLLNNESKAVCRRMAGCLCQDNFPAVKGKASSWACGIAYAVGKVNFLTDPTQKPHLTADEIAQGFGVSPATMYKRSGDLIDGLNLMPLDPDCTIPSLVGENPLTWMVEVDGFLMDMRTAPRNAQIAAFELGLIPYIPADQPNI